MAARGEVRRLRPVPARRGMARRAIDAGAGEAWRVQRRSRHLPVRVLRQLRGAGARADRSGGKERHAAP